MVQLNAGWAGFRIEHVNVRLDNPDALEHSHSCFEIAYFTTACLQIFVKDRPYDIRSGSLLLIKDYEIHRMIYTPQTHYARYVISFPRDLLAGVLRDLDADSWIASLSHRGCKKIDLTPEDQADVDCLLKILVINDKAGDDQQQYRRTHMLIDLIRLILLIVEYPEANEMESTMNRATETIKRIISYIDSSYGSTITLDHLAKKFFISKYYLSRTFRRLTGFTVVAYIQNRRVVEAKKMLRQTKHDITEIGFDCGFNSVQHFDRVFKQIVRMTPGQYRVKKEI